MFVFRKKLLEIFLKVTEEKIFANHISNKELIVQNIYKLSKINSKKTKLINIFKMGKRLEQTLHQRSIDDNHTKRDAQYH